MTQQNNEEKITDQEQLQALITTAYTEDSLTIEVIQTLRTGARRLKNFPLSECELREDQVYYRDRLIIPNNDELQLKILQLCYESLLAGHSGMTKLLKLIARTYWWPDWTKQVSQYLRNCQDCRWAKPSRLHYQGALKPLPVPERRWTDISMDFVIGLPSSPNKNGKLCTNLIVVMNRLSKQAHVIPWPKITAKDTAMAFYHRVFLHHGLPFTIVSDWGTQFVNYFWLALCDILGIKAQLFPAFHHETDRQTERTNVTIEMYLRMYMNFMQNDWAHWCSSAEFAYNNHLSEVTNCTSFLATSGQHSHMGTEPFIVNTNLQDHEQAQQWMAQDFVTKMILINDTLREQMTQAQTMYEEFSNHRRDHGLIIKKGDMVWLDARNLATERLSKKLSNKFKEPFRVIRTIRTHTSKLEIPENWGHHDVFGNYLLRLAATDPLSG